MLMLDDIFVGPEFGSPHQHENILWSELPDSVQYCRDEILEGLKRFDLEDVTLINSAICHPSFKGLSWITEAKQKKFYRTFMKKVCTLNNVHFNSSLYVDVHDNADPNPRPVKRPKSRLVNPFTNMPFDNDDDENQDDFQSEELSDDVSNVCLLLL